ncbi:DUF1311 domain-containing protein, partial [Enterobacter cloacae]
MLFFSNVAAVACLSASADELKQNIDSTLQKCKMDAVSTIDSQNCYIKATTA